MADVVSLLLIFVLYPVQLSDFFLSFSQEICIASSKSSGTWLDPHRKTNPSLWNLTDALKQSCALPLERTHTMTHSASPVPRNHGYPVYLLVLGQANLHRQ